MSNLPFQLTDYSVRETLLEEASLAPATFGGSGLPTLWIMSDGLLGLTLAMH